MRFSDRYPRNCDEICPICKRICVCWPEKHCDDSNIPTAHNCGKHWWMRFKSPVKIEIISGYIPAKEFYENQIPVFTSFLKKSRKK